MKVLKRDPELYLSKLIGLLVLISPSVYCEDNVLRDVSTTSGGVTGKTAITKWGSVIQFLGIPYATPPVGDRRFKPTKALIRNSLELGEAPVNSKDYPPACPQTEHIREFSHHSLHQGGLNTVEDCLKLNIYIPHDARSNDKLPILIWIPGEGFNYADAIQYDGSALAAKGRMLVVTVNYRVGVFGFMSSGNGTLGGNAGLYDILNAIKWVQINAKKFFGDMNAITLGGRFSGAMAISALLVSPMFYEEGKNDKVQRNGPPLVQRVILHDGIATGRYVIDHRPLDALYDLANITHCKKLSLMSTIECLQNLTATELLNESMKIPQLWKPVVDHDLLVGDPLDELAAGKYPEGINLLVGNNDGVGSLCYLSHSFQKTEVIPKFNQNKLNEKDLYNLIKQNLKEFYPMKQENEGLAAIATHEYMYGGGNETLREKYFRFCGAMYIRFPVEFATRSVATKASVYRYQWSYRSNRTAESFYPWWLHAAIGDEVVFLFPNSVSSTIETQVDDLIRDQILDAYINFVHSGNPSKGTTIPVWPKFTLDTKAMMNFGENTSVVSTDSLNRDVHFWRKAIHPLVQSLYELVELSGRERDKLCGLKYRENCPGNSRYCDGYVPERSVLSHVLMVVVILIGIIFLVAIAYFFFKNWKTPRSIWRFR